MSFRGRGCCLGVGEVVWGRAVFVVRVCFHVCIVGVVVVKGIVMGVVVVVGVVVIGVVGIGVGRCITVVVVVVVEAMAMVVTCHV